ncbi:hypothetical protein JKF63_01553 [Porcisia hertigi]|uniref:Uncharacterized protein n=1 Tax=Porcisia hertigi TaxID=2761500 RepID=A0A836H3H3_9TRYP|nr:hypothetical protein JKF63_01553 [Porcisia hertigi]
MHVGISLPEKATAPELKTIGSESVAVLQLLLYVAAFVILYILVCILRLIPRCRPFLAARFDEIHITVCQLCQRLRSIREAECPIPILLRRWDFCAVLGIAFILLYLCTFTSLSHLCQFNMSPLNLQLWTYQETHFELASMGPSLVSPVHDPRSLSPYGPRSLRTLAHFCGRPTASSYDGYTGVPHAAYIHHDVESDRYVVRVFGRGGMRVDERRRSGVGRSTYEAFCAAPQSVQRDTPLAPSPWLDGEANWQLGDAGAAPHHTTNGAFNFTVRPLAVPHAAAVAAKATGTTTTASSRTDDADFTKADQGLRTHYRRYTRDELLQRHAHLDFIFSYVNGSDVTRGYTKPFAKSWDCWNMIASAQLLWGEMQRAGDIGADAPRIAEDTFSRYITELLFVSSSPCAMSELLAGMGAGKDAIKRVEASLWWATRHPSEPQGAPPPPPPEMTLTNRELLRALGADGDSVKPDDIDADCDELRHAMRGLLRHTRTWHRGRIVVVTPYGNVPLWLNQSRNFFMRSLYAAATARAKTGGGAADGDDAGVLGTAEARFVKEASTGELHYTRIHVVDQRALMPPAPLTTVNSFTIEPFVYRLRNASSIFVYMNDDYLIMKDVDITDFVNEYGGPLLRVAVPGEVPRDSPKIKGFMRSVLLNSYHLQRELDQTPADLEELVQPAAAAAALVSAVGEETAVRRGIVRASWATFTAAVDARASVVAPGGSAQATSTACASNSSAEVCAWTKCAWGAADGALEHGACAMPRVSVEGEPSWTADAAGTFALVPPSTETPHSGEWTWAGKAQMPALVHWGRRVLDRTTADLIAPRYYLKARKIVAAEEGPERAPPAERGEELALAVTLMGHLLNMMGRHSEDIAAASSARALMIQYLEAWASHIATHEFPTHRIFKTQPRLRKYRMRLDSHAPYPQCRQMWGYIHKRYAPDLNLNMFIARKRTTTDLLPPSTHTAHMLRHPWAASSQYLPYLMAKQAWRMQRGAGLSPLGNETPVFPVVDVALDNEDGCAPATFHGEELKEAAYEEFDDDTKHNAGRMERIRGYQSVTAFTNINSKFSDNAVGETLRDFLEELFPTPMLLERDWYPLRRKKLLKTSDLSVSLSLAGASHTPGIQFVHLNTNFQRLMHLPLILVSNDEEGFCPLLRSLRHALPDFRGQRVVKVLVPPEDGVSLRAARAGQRHAYREILPVARCSMAAGRMRNVTLSAGSSVADVVLAGLQEARKGVAGAQWEAPALVELRGRRAVQALVLDARTLHAGAASFTELPHALAAPAELLAHEDFAEHLLDAAAQPLVRLPTVAEASAVAAVRPLASPNTHEKTARAEDFAASVLVLSEADARVRHTHWAYGASEHDLLSAMPLPYDKMEDMEEVVQWVF